jgi:hypothetical protein
MDGERIRDGIFSLRTRRFGSVAEFMVKRMERCGRARSQFHDLYDDVKCRRIEVKFSVVLKKADTPISEATVLQCIEEATGAERMVAFPTWKDHAFDCNIQQIKRTEFEVLYYGLFFSDCIKIFRIESSQIMENRLGGQIKYSDFQHKGNEGEGQFHINSDTLQIHLDNYLYQTLTYDELYTLLCPLTEH